MSRLINHFFAIALYGALLLATVKAGSRVTNYVLERVFLYDYLLPWRWAVENPMPRHAKWPEYGESGRQDAYMDEVGKMFSDVAGSVPKSNTEAPHVFRLNRIGEAGERVRLLVFPERIELHGLSAATFRVLDKALDGGDGPEAGDVRAFAPGAGTAIHAVWFLREPRGSGGSSR